MKDEKTKKDEYQKSLAAYAEAMKEFRTGKDEKALDSLRSFIEKHPGERELVDRARLYIVICENRLKANKEGAPLKTAEDFYHAGVYKINQEAFEEAQKLLEKALKISPEGGKIHYALADLFCLTGQTEPCLEALKKAIQIDKHFRVLAQNEIDFEPLWDDKKFKVLTRIS